MTTVTIRTTDGISHGVPGDVIRANGFVLATACGLEFQSWHYKGKIYGRYLDETLAELADMRTGHVDCMACVADR